MAQTFTASRDKGAVQTYDGVGRADKGAVEAVLVQDPAKCYNALFGKGNYESADASLEGHWELQDDSPSTTVVDSSGNGRDGTLNGGDNTADISTTGPTSWLPKAISFDGTSDYVSTPTSNVLSGSVATFIAWVRTTMTTNAVPFGAYGGSAGDYRMGINVNRGSSLPQTGYVFSDFGATTSHDATIYTASNQNIDNGTWRCIGASHQIGSLANSKIYMDGANPGTTWLGGGSTPVSTHGGLYIGATNSVGSAIHMLSGDIAGVATFSRILSPEEHLEAYSGPEPYLSGTAPTITGTIGRGETITLNAGTWNGQSNGTVYYTYELYSYSDTSGTDERLEKRITTTLTTQKVILRGSAIVGRYLRAVVTASNDGGFDPLEVYSTAYTAAVAAQSVSINGFTNPGYGSTVTLNIDVEDGQELIVFCNGTSKTFTSFSDTQGNTWTQLEGDVNAAQNYLGLWQATASATGSMTITGTINGNETGKNAICAAFPAGFAFSSSDSAMTGSVTSHSMPTVTAGDDSYVIGFACGSGVTRSAESTWEQWPSRGVYESRTVMYKFFADGGNVTPTYNTSIATNDEAYVAVITKTPVEAASYNALFGKGRHLYDPDISLHWKCDESTGATALVDSTNNSNDGTPSNTAITSVTGPTSWLTNGIKVDANTNATIASPSILTTNKQNTFVGYHKWNGGIDDFVFHQRNGAYGGIVIPRTAGIDLHAYGAYQTGVAATSGSWKFVGASFNGTTRNLLYGTTWHSGTGIEYLDANIPFQIGGTTYGPQLDEFSNVARFARAFTQSEFEETRDGPEPLNITAPSISGTATQGQTLTAVAGTWDNQSNGTVTASYVWYKADDTAGTNITQVGTGTTYTLQASDVGKYMILKERGTNDGGYDEAEDTYSAYTAVVAGSGGGATITAASGNYSLSGSAATLNEAKNVVSAKGTYTYTGYASAFNVSLSFVSAYGIYSVTGSVAGFLEEQVIISSSGNYTISGYTAGFPVQGDITGESGIYSISGSTANIILDEVIPSSSGTYGLSGQVATFNTAATTTFLLENGNYTYGGYYATWFVEDRVLIASPGNYTLSGKDMLFDVSAPSSIISQTGTYTISGSAAYQVVADRLVADSTTYTISGQAVNFNTAALVTFLAESGNYGISASSSTLLIHDRMILASPGNYQITGHDLYTVLESVIAANGGSYTVNGQEVLIRRIGFGSPYYYLLFRRL